MAKDILKVAEELLSGERYVSQKRDAAFNKLKAEGHTHKNFEEHNYWGIETAKLRNKLLSTVPALITEIKRLRALVLEEERKEQQDGSTVNKTSGGK